MNDKPHLPPYEVKEVPLSKVLAELSNWAFRFFRIKELWEHTKGGKVKVCVLDTGCTHKDISVYRSKDFTKTGLTDENGHGCLTGDTDIYIEKVGPTTLETIWNETNSPIFKEKNGEVKNPPEKLRTPCLNGFTNIRNLYKTKFHQAIIVETSLGEIKATPWHKFFVAEFLKYENNRNPFGNPDSQPHRKNGYKIIEVEARNLKTGDILVGPRFERNSIPQNFATDIAYLAGEIQGDGTIINKQKKSGWRYEIRICDKSERQLRRIAEVIKRLGSSPYIRRNGRNNKGYELGFASKKLVGIFSEFNLEETFADFEKICAWLAGFFDAEGYFNRKKGRVRISNANYNLLVSIQKVLKILGIKSVVHRVLNKEHKIKGHLIKASKSFQLYIPNSDSFYNLIKPYSLSEKITEEDVRSHYSADVMSIDSRTLARVKKVKKENGSHHFYDLCTEAQNYVASGTVVHNTWVSGCIRATGGFLGIAPECELYVGKILRKDGSGEWAWLEAGLEWALGQGCQVINVSAGGEYTGPTFPVLKKLDEAGVLTICAAGNSGTYLIYPAVSVHTIAVGAVDKAWERAAFSNVGLGLITMAPGVELLGCWKGDGYAKATGTSMATPIISGIVTLERALRKMNVREAITRFIETSKDIEIPGYDPLTGWGIVEPHKFLKIEEAEKRKWSWAWISNLIMFLFWYLLFRPKSKRK